MKAVLVPSAAPPHHGTTPTHYRFLRCCTLPRQRNRPLTMMAILVHSASHSSMLPVGGGVRHTAGTTLGVPIAGNPPVGCEQHGTALPDQAEDAVPQEASGTWVHPRRGFILQPQCQLPIGSCPMAAIPPTAPLTRKMMGGLPSRAMAVDSLRLLPPL